MDGCTDGWAHHYEHGWWVGKMTGMCMNAWMAVYMDAGTNE